MNERYELLEKIAEGGRGVVHRARDRDTGREVAFKRLNAHIAATELQREVRALTAIRHPGVVELLDSGMDETSGFLVLELLTGETLDARASRAALTLAEFHALAEQSLAALNAVHSAGFIHRDVKPENLVSAEFGVSTAEWRLLDFGLAVPLGEAAVGAAVGSVHFMAPEQFAGGPVDERTDMYALGCTLYFALSGRFPFDGETSAQVITAHLYLDPAALEAVPPAIAGWVGRLMRRRREERPADARECARLLGEAMLASLE